MNSPGGGVKALKTNQEVFVLTLTRKVGESVCIGDDIKVVVKEVKGKQVRLGIIAPREVYVCREELS